jgi:hypothetical protein
MMKKEKKTKQLSCKERPRKEIGRARHNQSHQRMRKAKRDGHRIVALNYVKEINMM